MNTDGANRQQAGALLGAARREKGVDLGALAAQLKVPLARLEALESGRWQELPDGPYARGLATAVCRALGVDPSGVLAAMPSSHAAGLERVAAGINQPFHDTVRRFPVGATVAIFALLLLVAAAVTLWPTKGTVRLADWVGSASPTEGPARAAEAEPDRVGQLGVEPSPAQEVVSVPPSAVNPPVATAPPSVPAAGAAVLRLAAAETSWIAVVDGQGRSLASRMLAAGEVLALEPQAPVRVVLGNAPGVSLQWRGQAQDLTAFERQRVAKLELQ